MVIRCYVSCLECRHKYLIRYNLGNKFPQTASYHCVDCGLFLEIGYDKDHKCLLKNLTEIDEEATATVKNLHPELTIDPALVESPTYFPSLDFMRHGIKQGGAFPDSFLNFRKNQFSAGHHQSEWDAIVTDFRYLKEKRWHLLEKKFGRDKVKAQKKILKAVVDAGRHFLTGKWNEQYRAVLVELENVKKHPEYEKLKTYLQSHSDSFLLEKMFSVMQEYRKVENTFLPTLLSQKQGIKPEGLSSSVNWEEIEMTYGNFFEVFGDLLVIPTAINNLLCRNDYTLFATPNFTLKDYIATDKAGRCKNFLTNGNLAMLQVFYDSNLRNGTHHKTASIDKEKQVITIKTGKGGNSTKDFSFIEYSEYCNEIYARCLILFNILFKAIH